MKTVSIWNPKGGQGKSLLSINLAGCAVKSFGITPLIIDQDPQGTCISCYTDKESKLPFEVISEIPNEKPDGIDLVIIDHQASDWTLPPTKTVVMPLLPQRSQYRTFLNAREQLKQKGGSRVIAVVTNVLSTRTEEDSVVANLRKKGAFILESSAVFGRADANLTTIFNNNIKKIKEGYKVKERRAEVEAILTAILHEEAEE